jgi:hypothetical protein
MAIIAVVKTNTIASMFIEDFSKKIIDLSTTQCDHCASMQCIEHKNMYQSMEVSTTNINKVMQNIIDAKK